MSLELVHRVVHLVILDIAIFSSQLQLSYGSLEDENLDIFSERPPAANLCARAFDPRFVETSAA